ncbi:hypothetical protein R1sor_010782 [Riccia sorocarpa]|uniref:Uncharacterized protein n=1 Tax=Riccia sorocarpa TaxID=122646 RepID=A0ABD3I0G7_9MARC
MAEEDANGLTLKDRMEIRNRDEICYNLELVLSAMYEANHSLAIGFQADNIMAMREAFRSVVFLLSHGGSARSSAVALSISVGSAFDDYMCVHLLFAGCFLSRRISGVVALD